MKTLPSDWIPPESILKYPLIIKKKLMRDMNVGPTVFSGRKKKSPEEKHLCCSENAGTDRQLVCRPHNPKPYSFSSKAPSLSK